MWLDELLVEHLQAVPLLPLCEDAHLLPLGPVQLLPSDLGGEVVSGGHPR
jgi:hypothetical protein